MFVNPEHNQKVAKCSGLTLFRAAIQVPGTEPYIRDGAPATARHSPTVILGLVPGTQGAAEAAPLLATSNAGNG